MTVNVINEATDVLSVLDQLVDGIDKKDAKKVYGAWQNLGKEGKELVGAGNKLPDTVKEDFTKLVEKLKEADDAGDFIQIYTENKESIDALIGSIGKFVSVFTDLLKDVAQEVKEVVEEIDEHDDALIEALKKNDHEFKEKFNDAKGAGEKVEVLFHDGFDILTKDVKAIFHFAQDIISDDGEKAINELANEIINAKKEDDAQELSVGQETINVHDEL
jgi:oligoendopeptidase F